MARDGTADLEQRLRMARRRLAAAAPHGPEWDAATEAVLELESRLGRAAGPARAERDTARGAIARR